MRLARNRRTGQFTAWIAIFAVLLAALAPAVARAFASPQQGTPWSEICTVAGIVAIHDVAPEQPSGRHDAGGFTHCPFCLNHASNFFLPAAALDWLAAAPAGSHALLPTVETQPARFIRTAAQPRAPPANS